jgi:hypothetical protein
MRFGLEHLIFAGHVWFRDIIGEGSVVLCGVTRGCALFSELNIIRAR